MQASNQVEPVKEDSSDQRVGVILITGFLGSGKSTLIRRILTENHGLRVVVVENEFGDNAKVEEAIVTQGVGSNALEEFIELPNGCICCAAQDDLTDALTRLIDQKQGQFDYILIEVSGLADPGPVAASFWVDEWDHVSLQLDAVVTVVDAANILRLLDEKEDSSPEAKLVRKQLAVADRILLNKVDLVSSSELDQNVDEQHCRNASINEITQRLEKEGCSTSIERTVQCNVDIATLLNIHAYDDNCAQNLFSKAAPSKFDGHVHNGEMNVGTITITFQDVCFAQNLLDRAFGNILWEQGESTNGKPMSQEVWRIKALVVMEEEEYKWIYQSVDTLFDHLVSNESSSGQDGALSQFIFIGRDLERTYLERVLRKAICLSSEQR